jgi:hypothetical protein
MICIWLLAQRPMDDLMNGCCKVVQCIIKKGPVAGWFLARGSFLRRIPYNSPYPSRALGHERATVGRTQSFQPSMTIPAGGRLIAKRDAQKKTNNLARGVARGARSSGFDCLPCLGSGRKRGIHQRALGRSRGGSPVKFIVSVMPEAVPSPSTSRPAKRRTARVTTR